MTLIRGAVVKSAVATGIHPIAGLNMQSRKAAPVVEPTEVEKTLADELAERLALCEAATASHATALEKAFADGEKAGKAAAEDVMEERREAALSMLAQALESARKDLGEALVGFESLALQAALEALNVLTGDPENYRNILAAAIRKQVSELDAQSIVTMTVSRSDFPDSRELGDIESDLGAATGSLRLSDEMESGHCRIELKIGAVELDMKRSLADIAEVLALDEIVS